MTSRPVPVPDGTSAAYWRAAAEHVLTIARCSRCQQVSHPPDGVCPKCYHHDPAFVFEPVTGGATVRSWIVLYQSFVPGFDDDLPILLVDVALDDYDDVRLIGRLLDGIDAPLAVGERVSVEFEDVAHGVSVPAFRLEGSR